MRLFGSLLDSGPELHGVLHHHWAAGKVIELFEADRLIRNRDSGDVFEERFAPGTERFLPLFGQLFRTLNGGRVVAQDRGLCNFAPKHVLERGGYLI